MRLIVEGGPWSGKTWLCNELSKKYNVPVWKFNPLEICDFHVRETLMKNINEKMFQMVNILKPDIIFDRFHLSEIIMSKVLNRKVDAEYYWNLDKLLAKAGCKMIYIKADSDLIRKRLNVREKRSFDKLLEPLLPQIQYEYDMAIRQTKIPFRIFNSQSDTTEKGNIKEWLEGCDNKWRKTS